MAWVALGSAAITAGGSYLASRNKGKGGGGAPPMRELPPFWNDPYVGKTQDTLYKSGTDLLAGEINDYYKPIGEIGGPMFEDYLGKVSRDTQKATEEGAIRRGFSHGGGVDSAIAKNVSDMSAKMRWEDVLRALDGRKGFLTLGDSQVKTVGQNALENQRQKNSYELGAYGAETGAANNVISQASSAGASSGEGISDWFGLASKLAGQIAPTGTNIDTQAPQYLSAQELARLNKSKGLSTI